MKRLILVLVLMPCLAFAGSGSFDSYGGQATAGDLTTETAARVAADALKVAKAGDTMTGPLTLSVSSFTIKASSMVITDGNFSLFSTAASYPSIYLYRSGGATEAGRIWYDSVNGDFRLKATNSTFMFGASNGYRFYGDGAMASTENIDLQIMGASGFVGINDYAPDALLDITATAPIAPTSPVVLVSSANDTTSLFQVNADGNVGIGTTSPGSKLHVSSGTITMDGTGAPTSGFSLCISTTTKGIGICKDITVATGGCGWCN